VRPSRLFAVAILALAGCTTTLSEQDCARYRDKLIAWAAEKGVDKKAEAETFMQSCPGTNISKGTKRCLESATDDAAFQKCLE
jgi:hypothetical protein